mgnify:CR=1 FL=1
MKARALHRDLGYLYIGLIISFAFSGILMNHRKFWEPEKFTVEKYSIAVILPQKEKLNDTYAKELTKLLSIDDVLKYNEVKDGKYNLYYNNHNVSISLNKHSGEVIHFYKTPLISQMMQLHKSTSNWWIYYGDIFGISLITIAITGAIMIPSGKFSFKNRGWKLALLGIIFPLVVLFLLT